MPKNKVSTPISDKEVKFAHLVLAGEMTDEEAARAAGLPPSTANYVKAKPRVKAYMELYRDSVRAAIAKHEAKTIIEFNVTRAQGLQRLWAIASMSGGKTGHTMSAQVSALKELFDRMGWKAPSAEEESSHVDIYQAAWLRESTGGGSN